MSDRVGLIGALNPTLGLMSDGFCQACPRLAIYRKVRKNSLSAQFSVGRYIVLITKPSSSPSRPHHQAVPITKPSPPPSRPHHQAVPTKSSPPSRPYQAVLITKQSLPPSSAHHQAILTSDRSKSTYQANLPSHLIKPLYQAILSSDRSKHTLRSCYDRLLRSLATVAFECLLRLDRVT
jgi:hypothetical protein